MKKKFSRSRKLKKITVKEEIKGKKIYFYFYNNAKKICLKDGINLLQKSEQFRKLCTEKLRSVPFKAYQIKLTAFNKPEDFERKDKYFKLTVMNAPGLYNNKQNSSKFEKYFTDNDICDKYFCSIISPSGNELLIPKPLPGSHENAYVHIANFIKYAPSKQIDHFWKFMAKRIKKHIKHKPVLYLNTHGFDVPWLHVRLDTDPVKIQWNF
jgi:hypothetical protein